jgi:hypothetical protein
MVLKGREHLLSKKHVEYISKISKVRFACRWLEIQAKHSEQYFDQLMK